MSFEKKPYDDRITGRKLKFYIQSKMGETNSAILIFYKYKKIFKEKNIKLELANSYEEADVVWRYTGNVRLENKISVKFPDVNFITQKDNLYKTIVDTFGEDQDIITKTYTVNNENELLILHNKINSDPKLSKLIYIIKPVAEYGGIGIEVMTADKIKSYKMVDNRKDEMGRSNNKSIIVQEYIANPLLFNGKKFDLRVNYVLQHDGTCYMYNHILLRISESDYELNDLDKEKHVTNLHNREENEETARLLEYEPSLSHYTEKIIEFSKKYIVKLLKVIYDSYYIRGCDRNEICRYNLKNNVICFQTFGIDLLLTDDGHIYTYDFNGTPGSGVNDYLTKMKFMCAFKAAGLIKSDADYPEDLSPHFTVLS
jgi:hypothetical protein